VIVLMAGAASGLPLPILPLQILWLNLVTDTFPALALAFEPAEPSIMGRPPRSPEASILSKRFVGSITFYAGLIAASTLGAFGWGLLTGPVDRAVTLSFMTLALAQLFHLGNARSRHAVLRPARMFANPWAVGAVPLVIGLQVLAVHWPPLARVLGTVPLTLAEWAGVAGLSLLPAVVGQSLELVRDRGSDAAGSTS
jgi:Ca2+-transporting ATPase